MNGTPEQQAGPAEYPIQVTFITVREVHFISHRPPSPNDKIEESTISIRQAATPFNEATRRVQVTLNAEFGRSPEPQPNPPPFSVKVAMTGEFDLRYLPIPTGAPVLPHQPGGLSADPAAASTNPHNQGRGPAGAALGRYLTGLICLLITDHWSPALYPLPVVSAGQIRLATSHPTGFPSLAVVPWPDLRRPRTLLQ
jgi:hypothetical protein